MENPTIFIDSPYSNLLNKVVAEMISRDYTLKAIDNYVFQIEQFLNFVSSTEIEGADFRSYIQSIKGDTSLQALHFFFKEVLKPTVVSPLCK